MHDAEVLVYDDRDRAGEALAQLLVPYASADAVVVGIGPGGLAVGAAVARTLRTPLDVLLVHPIGAPHAPELSIGTTTADGVTYLLPAIRRTSIQPEYVQRVAAHAIERCREAEQRVRGERPPVDLAGRHVILVDDSLTTDMVAQAALRSVRHQGPGRVVLAAPVGTAEACEALRQEVSILVCPMLLPRFARISAAYRSFTPVEESEAADLLARIFGGAQSRALVTAA